MSCQRLVNHHAKKQQQKQRQFATVLSMLVLFSFLLLALAAVTTAPAPVAAQATPTPSPTPTPTPTPAPAKPKLTWEAWLVIVVILIILVVLVLEAAPVPAVMVTASLLLYLLTIVSVKDLFSGLPNNGTLAIAILFIIVKPLAELPAVKKGIMMMLDSGSGKDDAAAKKKKNDDATNDTEMKDTAAVAVATSAVAASGDDKKEKSVLWPLFKVNLVCLLTSSFIENTPQVAMFTPLIAKFCREHNMPASQILMPMNFAVILGNFAVVGCSSSLVISGLMSQYGMGQMEFFELAKVGLPLLPFILVYLTVAPRFLLPFNSPVEEVAAAGERKQVAHKFRARVVLRAESPLVGKKFLDVQEEFCAGGPDQTVEIEKVYRKDGTVIDFAKALALHEEQKKNKESASGNGNADGEAFSPQSSDKTSADLAATVIAGDQFEVSALPSAIAASVELLHLDFVTANMNLASDTVQGYMASRNAVRSVENEPLSGPEESSSPPSTQAPPDEVKIGMFEAVVSPTNPFINRTVASREFQSHYAASILSIRSQQQLYDSGAPLRDHLISAGDQMLIVAPQTLELEFGSSGDFFFLTPLSTKPDRLIKSKYLVFPRWFPFGQLQGDTKETQKKIVRTPWWYNYLALVVFLGIVISAMFHVKLSVSCLLGAVVIVGLGILTTSEAIKSIHLDVYILVAFSFPIGIAVKKSGLAAVIGQALIDAQLKGFTLLLIISIITLAMTNLITNKAACQVMFPIIVEVYKVQNKDPLPAIITMSFVVVVALCTPYAIPPNVIIFHPGKYTAKDYVVFGLPLSLLLMILTPLSAAAVYNTW